MKAIRLPSWGEVMAPDAPWALHLRSGTTGTWLMRGEAEDVPWLDCRFVAAVAAPTAEDARAEFAAALELGREVPETWQELARAVAATGSRALALLVTDAERLVADEPGQLGPLLAALRNAADDLAARDSVLRVVFQARELLPDAEPVFREFGVEEIR